LKKQWGNFTDDDDLLQIAGDQRRLNGAVQQRYGETNGEVNKWADRWYAQTDEGYEGVKPKCLTVQRTIVIKQRFPKGSGSWIQRELSKTVLWKEMKR
jgi:uncharacterized protein YjbJ (UPF0337 family)